MPNTIDKSTIEEITLNVFGVQLAIDQEITLGEKAIAFAGKEGEKVFGYFHKEEAEEVAALALFYESGKDSITLDNDRLGSLPLIEPLLSPLKLSGAGKVWFCYTSEETMSVPEEVLSQITGFGQTQLKLDEGTTIIFTIEEDAFSKAFGLPSSIFPFGHTSLKLHFGEEAMNFVVRVEPKWNWLGEAFKCDALEVGLLATYGGDEPQQYQLYLSAQSTLFGFSAVFFATVDIAEGKPQGIAFEIHPAMQINVEGGIEKLGELFSGDAEWKLPSGIELPSIQINSIAGAISFTSGVTALSGDISAVFDNEGWSPMGKEFITLEKVDLGFSWQKGLPVSWRVGGEVGLFDVYKLNAAYSHPNQIISGQLMPSNDGKQNLQVLLKTHLGMGVAADVVSRALTAFDLSVYADIPGEEIEFKVKNAEEWELIKDVLIVCNLEIRANWFQRKFAEAELYLDLKLPIGPDKSEAMIQLEAAYDATDTPALWHFEAEINDPIAVGDLIAGLAEKFGAPHSAIPEQIKDLTLDDLYLSFDHQGENSQFKFSGNVIFPFSDDKDFTLHLEVAISKTGGTGVDENKTAGTSVAGSNSTWAVHLSTWIYLAGYQFDVDFESDKDGKFLIASLSSDAKVNLSSLLEEIAPGEVDAFIPDDLELGLQNAFIAFYFPKAPVAASSPSSPPPKTTVVFGLELEISGNLDLGQVPGIGPLLGKADITLESMRIVGSTVDISADTLTVIDGKLGEKGIKGLVDGPLATTPAPTASAAVPPPAFRKGVSLAAELHLPGLVVKLAHSFGAKPASAGVTGASTAGKTLPGTPAQAATATATTAPAVAAPAATAPQKNRMLTPVGKQIGPLFVESIGLAMMDGKFGLKFTGGVVMGPLVLELINFSVASPFDRFAPSFDLDGIAIGYDKIPLTVAGLLMKVEEKKPENADEKTIIESSFGFQGGISIGFKQISITALGAYSQVKKYEPAGHFKHSFHSFFLYGYLGAPLGGPPFLFVTGLALGVGFNRGLNLPKPEDFGIFPLTAAALKPSGTALSVTDLKDMMLSLDSYIPIKEGNFWFAAGIKFESFKILSGFLMLTVEFGDELEIGVLGILDAIMPVGAPNPLIRISIGFTVRILPERGVVEVRGSFLPTTFILHQDVKLQGGMALLAIMKDQKDGDWAGARAGEFVFTLGGYGPLYHPKPYYPTVPALQLDWKVNENLFITASAYFALTPEAIMLGGHFHGHFDYTASILTIEVDLKLDADFIIFWQPLRYLGEVSADFHLKGTIHVGYSFVSVDHSLSLDASARMSIWGPDFSGKANLKLHFFVSFEVEVEFGAASKEIKAIEWKAFKESLLPPIEKVVSLSLIGGLVQDSVQRDIPTVNPHEVKLVLDTQIPVKTKDGELVPLKEKDGKPSQLGIKPMGLQDGSFQSDVVFTITGANKDDFDFTPVYKNVPAALWQPATSAGEIPVSNGKDLIEGVVCGYELTAKRPTLGAGITISASSLNDTLMGQVGDIAPFDGFDWSAQLAFSNELIKAFHNA